MPPRPSGCLDAPMNPARSHRLAAGKGKKMLKRGVQDSETSADVLDVWLPAISEHGMAGGSLGSGWGPVGDLTHGGWIDGQAPDAAAAGGKKQAGSPPAGSSGSGSGGGTTTTGSGGGTTTPAADKFPVVT